MFVIVVMIGTLSTTRSVTVSRITSVTITGMIGLVFGLGRLVGIGSRVVGSTMIGLGGLIGIGRGLTAGSVSGLVMGTSGDG